MTDQNVMFSLAETATELRQCFGIRAIVFWEGQKIPCAIDIDGMDEQAIHVLAKVAEEPVATARLRLLDGAFKVERIAVRPSFRGQGLGHRLMEYIDEVARVKGIAKLRLNAQAHLEDFYASHGYETVGEPFTEAEILHVSMKKALSL